jgi:hypothetical protein
MPSLTPPPFLFVPPSLVFSLYNKHARQMEKSVNTLSLFCSLTPTNNNNKHPRINFNTHHSSINSCYETMEDQRANDSCFSLPHPRTEQHHLHLNPKPLFLQILHPKLMHVQGAALIEGSEVWILR